MADIMNKNEMIAFDSDTGEMILAEECVQRIRQIEEARKNIEKDYKKWKQALLEAMEDNGIKKFENDDIVISYVEPTERLCIDTEKLWSEHKDIAFECQKFSPVKSSVRITLR